MKIILVPVTFRGEVEVQVPDHLGNKDAKMLANKLAVARILATTDNPDAPEDDAYGEYTGQTNHNERLGLLQNRWRERRMGKPGI